MSVLAPLLGSRDWGSSYEKGRIAWIRSKLNALAMYNRVSQPANELLSGPSQVGTGLPRSLDYRSQATWSPGLRL